VFLLCSDNGKVFLLCSDNGKVFLLCSDNGKVFLLCSDNGKVFFVMPLIVFEGRDGSVGIATRYGLDGPGIESQ